MINVTYSKLWNPIPTWSMLSFLDMYIFFIKFGELFSIVYSDIFSAPFSLSLLFLGLPLCVCWYNWWCPSFLKLCSDFFILFFFSYSLDHIILIHPYLNLVILSSASPNLLLSPSSENLFNYYYFLTSDFLFISYILSLHWYSVFGDILFSFFFIL